VYFEEYERIDEAFYREKQVQGWSRKKKQALINAQLDKLPGLAKNYTKFPPSRPVPSTGSGTGLPSVRSSLETPSVRELVEGVIGVEGVEGR
jgi:putative endonuclease